MKRNKLNRRTFIKKTSAGLLMDILQIFLDQNMSVQSAKISTYGEKVFDIFQITDLKNKKVKDTKILKTL